MTGGSLGSMVHPPQPTFSATACAGVEFLRFPLVSVSKPGGFLVPVGRGAEDHGDKGPQLLC